MNISSVLTKLAGTRSPEIAFYDVGFAGNRGVKCAGDTACGFWNCAMVREGARLMLRVRKMQYSQGELPTVNPNLSAYYWRLPMVCAFVQKITI